LRGGAAAQRGDRMSLRLRPVPFTRVALADPFWAPRREINRAVTLLDRGSRLASLDRYALDTRLPAHVAFDAKREPAMLGGIVTLRGMAQRMADDDGALYRHAPPQLELSPIVAVPYAVWDNREAGEMRVWLRETSRNLPYQ